MGRAARRAGAVPRRPRPLDHRCETRVAAVVKPVARREQEQRAKLDRVADPAARAPSASRRGAGPVDRATSSARAIRALSAGPSRAAASGSALRQPRAVGLRRRPPGLRLGSRDRSAAPARCRRSRCADRGRCRRPGSAAVRLRGCRRSRPAPAPPSPRPTSQSPRRRCRRADARRVSRSAVARRRAEDRQVGDRFARCRH